MGSDTLVTKNPGDVVSSADPNQYKSALGVNMVPRNVSGVAADLAGDLGQTTLRWNNAYIGGFLQLGTIASGLKIVEDSGELTFEVGGSEVARMDANGLTRSSFPTTGVLRDLKIATFTSSGTWTVPDNVTSVIVLGCGGGGGGGGGGANYGGGGGGGSGAQPITAAIAGLTPGASISVVIGAGGNAGAGGISGGNGVVGANGNPSSFGTLVFNGGLGGDPGVGSTLGGTNPAGGAGAAEAMTPMGHRVAGGGGGAGAQNGTSVAGTAGSRSMYATAPSGGASAGTGTLRGGGGGGGGSATNAGGTGGNANVGAVGSVGADGSNGSGGGGGGGGSNNLQGGNGGAGGGGLIQIYYVE